MTVNPICRDTPVGPSCGCLLVCGDSCSSKGSHFLWGQLLALAVISSYGLELCEGFKDKHSPFLCLTLWPGGAEDGFRSGFYFPSLSVAFLLLGFPSGCLAWCSQDAPIAAPTCPSPHGFWLGQAWWGHKDMSQAVVMQGETCPHPTGVTGRVG